MQYGEIAQQGTHSERVTKGGIYADLWERQSGGFITSPVHGARLEGAAG